MTMRTETRYLIGRYDYSGRLEMQEKTYSARADAEASTRARNIDYPSLKYFYFPAQVPVADAGE